MSLDTATAASAIESEYSSLIETGSDGRAAYAGAWESAYLAYGTAGVVPIAIGPAVGGIVQAGLLSLVGYESANITKLAQMFADYWATSHLLPLPPAVSIVGNDALTKVSAFEAAIRASYTTSISTPAFKTLLDNVEGVVKTIIWTGLDVLGKPVTGKIS